MLNLIPLALIPLCGLLNHEGGQSTTIPDPRVTARMVAPGIAFGLAAWLAGYGWHQAATGGGIVIVGLVLWAVWGWAQGFMAFTGQDARSYSKMT